MGLAPETRLGPYIIKSQIGAGGMGEVYRSFDPRLNRSVAIKILPMELAADPQALARFQREACAVATVSHPNVVAIHDVGQSDTTAYVVLELLEGRTLRQELADGPVPQRRAVEIALAVAEGLGAAHDRGIAHRDLKPENIFITSAGQVKILDFGLAAELARKLPADAPTLRVQTEPGTILGTPGYMSPEQVRGHPADVRSDLFALGCVLYEMLTGRSPFRRGTVAESLAAILHEQPQALETAPELNHVVERCMAKNPAERFQSASDLAFALRETLSAPAVSGAGSRQPARSRWFRVALALAALASIATVVLVRRYFDVTRRPAIEALAVLPFEGAQSDQYLVDGMTESVINSLSALQGLRVLAPATVFRYRGQTKAPAAVARELGVDSFVTGRMVREQSQLLVTVSLARSDGTQIWGERYRRPAADIFSVQDQIATEISTAIRSKLTGEELQNVTKRYTDDREAYELYLKGRFFWNKRTREGLRSAESFFKAAIERDPTYALAYAGLADCYAVMATFGHLDPRDAYPKAKAAAMKGLEIDPALAEAHASLGYVHQFYDWKFRRAQSDLARAIALKPAYAPAHQWQGVGLAMLGRFAESRRAIDRALELDPLSMVIHHAAAFTAYFARDYDRALAEAKNAIELEPGFDPPRRYLEQIYILRGQHELAVATAVSALEARARKDEARELALAFRDGGWRGFVARRLRTTEGEPPSRHRASLLLQLGRREEALREVERMIERKGGVHYLKYDPALDSLRNEPRFIAAIAQVYAAER